MLAHQSTFLKKALGDQVHSKLKHKVQTMYNDSLPDELSHLRLRMNVKMRDYYRILANPIGHGAYGEVRKVIYKECGVNDKSSFYKEYRAVKILDKSHMNRENIESFENEVRINMHIQHHPNVLKVHHYFEDRNRFMLIMEMCNGGDLYSDIVKREKFDPSRAAFITKQLLSVLYDMHEGKPGIQGIVHRDLKPENVMLVDNESLLPEVKLIDFGAACMFTKGESQLKRTIGTMGYMAPELVLAKEYGEYNELVDIWSIGCIVYFMLTGEMPFIIKDNDRKANISRTHEFISNGENDDVF